MKIEKDRWGITQRKFAWAGKCVILKGLLVGALFFSRNLLGNETAFWQEKVDAANAAGGGRVTMPPGHYVIAGLQLKSGVELHLEEGAEIWAVTNLEAYAFCKKRSAHPAVIFAMGATNVSITGKGIIDGRGKYFDRVITRTPHLKLKSGWKDIYLRDCRHVRIEDVTLKGATSWTCFLNDCEACEVRRMKIHAHANFNNDGLDIKSSNVLVEDCDIDSEDDAIVFKTGTVGSRVENVVVRRCRLSTNSAYVKFGTETRGTFKNVVVEDCHLECRTPIFARSNHLHVPGVKDTKNGICGLNVSVVDGGSLEDVVIRNITMGDGVNTPIMMRLGERNKPESGKHTYLRNVLFENVKMTKPATSFQACPIVGLPENPLEGITFRNMTLLFQGGGKLADARTIYRSERTKAYPTPPNVYKHILPAYAFYVRHAKGIRFENVKTVVNGKDLRPAVMTESAEVAYANCSFALPKGCSEDKAVVARPLKKRQLILAGDSTLQYRENTSKAGSWGEMLRAYLPSEMELMNCAIGGRSTRTYMDEWKTNVVKRINSGDWVMIQFGHNDMSKASNPKAPERRTDPNTTYKDNLRAFIKDVRARKGKPLLCTSITLYLYDEKGNLKKNPLTPWVKAMREVAAEMKVPLVDMNALTYEALTKAGAQESFTWYMKSIDGKDWAHPTKAGAKHFGELFRQNFRGWK